jgi:hypothetical protein
MKKYFTLKLIAALSLYSLSALANPVCKKDAEELCKNRDLGEIARCLLNNESKISITCSAKLLEGFDREPKCLKARRKICKDKEMGRGLGKCIVENEAALEEACK